MKRRLRGIILAGLIAACAPQVIPVATDLPAVPSIPPSLPPSPTSTMTPWIAPSPSATFSCVGGSGQVVDTEYPSKIEEGLIPIRIYLPPCYESEPIRYPVLFLLHGYPFNESHWGDLGVVEVAEEGIQARRWDPFIMVMPYIPRSLNVETDGGPGSYEQEMLESLLPFIDEHYRTLADPGHRALAGISRGAVWAMEISFRNPDQINIVAALSPALPMNYPRPEYDPFVILQSSPRLPEKIFLGVGDEEMGFRRKTEQLVALMSELGVPHTFLLVLGRHEASTWMAMMRDLIDFIAEAWKQPGS